MEMVDVRFHVEMFVTDGTQIVIANTTGSLVVRCTCLAFAFFATGLIREIALVHSLPVILTATCPTVSKNTVLGQLLDSHVHCIQSRWSKMLMRI